MATLTIDFIRGYVLGERRMSVPVAYQWDQGHVLEFKIPTAVTSAEVHYSQSGMDGNADAYEPDDITAEADGTYTITSHVPNGLFESGCSVEVYVVVTDDDAYITTYQGRIHVVGREKPGDYVDTDPDNAAAKIMAISFSDPDGDGHIIVSFSSLGG